MRSVVPLDLSCDADFGRWQEFIGSRPDTRYGDLGQWRRIFRELYGLKSVDLACVEEGRVVGAVSLYRIASPFFGRLLVTCPFFGYGGLYADSPAVRDALLSGVEDAARDLGVDFVEFRLPEPLGEPYRTRNDFLEFELALGESEEVVWNESLSSNVRQNVRKSRDSPLVFSTTRDPSGPYALISTTLRDLGTPFHARRLFDLMVDHLGDHLCFSEVRLDERLVAAGVMLRCADRMSTPYIGSLSRYRSSRANYCQYWGILRHCIDNGVRCFDLGRSPRGSTHQRFKQKWGAAPVEVHYSHRSFASRREYRSVTDASRLELMASGIWKWIPVFLTRRVGHLAARYIP